MFLTPLATITGLVISLGLISAQAFWMALVIASPSIIVPWSFSKAFMFQPTLSSSNTFSTSGILLSSFWVTASSLFRQNVSTKIILLREKLNVQRWCSSPGSQTRSLECTSVEQLGHVYGFSWSFRCQISLLAEKQHGFGQLWFTTGVVKADFDREHCTGNPTCNTPIVKNRRYQREFIRLNTRQCRDISYSMKYTNINCYTDCHLDNINMQNPTPSPKHFLKQTPLAIRPVWQSCLCRPRQTFNYRDTLIKQLTPRTSALILLCGTVTITKQISSGSATKRLLLGQANAIDIIGTDCLYEFSPINYYTYTASSSGVECVRITPDEALELAAAWQEGIKKRELRHRKVVNDELRRLGSSVKKNGHTEVEMKVLRSQLPLIKTLQSSPSLNTRKWATRSVKIEKPRLFDQIIELPRNHLKLLGRTPDKSTPSNPSPDKLFKQNLKNIIRRKISYETKEFAVLKFFKRVEAKQPEVVEQEEEQKVTEGAINKFFNFAEFL